MAREGCEQEAGRCKAQQGSLFGSSRAEQGHGVGFVVGVVGQWDPLTSQWHWPPHHSSTLG